MSLASPSPTALPRPDLNLSTYVEIIRRRRAIFIQVFVMVVAIGLVITALSKPIYQTYAKLMVPTGGPALTVMDASNPINTMLAAARPEPLKTQIEVMQSYPFQNDVRALVPRSARADAAPPVVSIEPLEGMNIIRVTVEGGDPKEITDYCNKMLDLHLERTDLLATTNLQGTMDFVEHEKERARKRLLEVERKIVAFRQSHRVVELTAQQQAQQREYIDLQSKVGEAQNNIQSIELQLTQLRKRLESEPLDLLDESTKENPRFVRFRDEVEALTAQREELLRSYKPTSRRIQDLDTQITAAQQRLANEPKETFQRIRTPNPIRPNLQAKVSELEASLEAQTAQFNTASAQFNARKGNLDNYGLWEFELSRLNREQGSAQTAYVFYSDRLRDLEIRKETRITTARIIERALPPDHPIRPNKTTNLALTCVLALCLAAAMAFLQEFLDDRVNAPNDLERFSSMPALGHVPMMEEATCRLLSSLPANSQIAESYRGLRSTIGFAGIDTPLRRLLVTSSSKGEGKSVTSANLATAMAMDGKRVILVDADLRRPNQHRLFQMQASPGLSEVLVGMRTLDEAIQTTELENLRVICAGPIPPNPAELLNSRAFDTLLEELDERADVVIFDSPPCIPVTDPLIIAGRMDGVILVLQVGQTRKAAVKHAQELLERARARIIGAVFNRVHQGKSGYYYYYNYYYSADGYYSEDEPRHRNGRNGKGGRPKLAAGQAVQPRSWQVKSDDDDA